MSRSVRKHYLLKYGSPPRSSWKSWKVFVNRFNRRKSRFVLKTKEDFLYKDRRLCSWDFEFCKMYISEQYVDYKIIRK